jgi:ATP-binding cassette subfamily B protein
MSLRPNAPLSRAEADVLKAAADPILQRMLAEERVEAQQIDSALLWRIMRSLRPHGWLVAFAMTMATAEAFLLTVPPWAVGLAVDTLQGQVPAQGLGAWASSRAVALGAALGADADAVAIFVGFGALVALLWAIRWLLGVASMFGVQLLGQRVVHDLRLEVYGHLLTMDLGYFHANPVGRLVNRATFDVQALAEFFSDAVAEGIRDVLFVMALAVVMLRLDAGLGLLLLSALPVLVLVAHLYRVWGRPALRSMSAVQSRMNGWLAENFAGMRDNQLLRLQARRRAEFHALTDAHQSAVTRVIRAWGLLRPAMMLTTAFATVAVLMVGAARVEAGTLTLGVLLTFLQYTGRLWIPVRNLAEKFNLIQTSLTSAERIADVLDARTAMKDEADADPTLRVTRGEVTFHGVGFRYPGTARDVLRDVSFHVAQGETLALVGDTGAGKSTVAHLLSRFYDASAGEVRVDGVPVRRWTLAGLRRGIALVPQDVVVLAASLRENLTLGEPVEDARLVEALEAVGAGPWFHGLEHGLDERMEEGGRTLSQGQRQLLAFARALVARPAIILLDEATASVDSQTEQLVQQGLSRLMEGRTCVIIAHRLSTIQNADQILVMEHGEVVERGRHGTLLAQGGRYARLHALHHARPQAGNQAAS